MTETAEIPNGPQIVLIEDDPLVRFGQEVLLRDWGYRVIAGESSDSIEAALHDAPDDIAAIIADYNVNGRVNGADIARTLAQRARRVIPTLLMSASLGRHSGTTAQDYGFAFLAKPVNPEELRAWLATVTGAAKSR